MDPSNRLAILLGSSVVSTAELEDSERLALFKACLTEVRSAAGHMSWFYALTGQFTLSKPYIRLAYEHLLEREDSGRKIDVPESLDWRRERCLSVYDVDLPRVRPLHGFPPRSGTFTKVLLTQKGKVLLFRCQYRNAPAGTQVQAVRLFEPTDEELTELLKSFCFKTFLARMIDSLDEAIRERTKRLGSLRYAQGQLERIKSRML